MTVRRILVIHDDPRRAARLALELRDEGYTMISDADPTVGLSDGFDRMRRKLDHPVNVPSHISTIRGIGYRFETG